MRVGKSEDKTHSLHGGYSWASAALQIHPRTVICWWDTYPASSASPLLELGNTALIFEAASPPDKLYV